ncbi:MAG TPA: hypothetical protein VLH87_01400 [Pyrinomonadaceae bacterium]|nr:hypothetical protein [Pyrinomonadaceae bacterium]
MTIERAFIALAGLLVITAAVFLWRENISAAFVIGALGAVAWFISYRFHLRASFPVTDDENESIDDDDDELHNEVENDHTAAS